MLGTSNHFEGHDEKEKEGKEIHEEKGKELLYFHSFL